MTDYEHLLEAEKSLKIFFEHINNLSEETKLTTTYKRMQSDMDLLNARMSLAKKLIRAASFVTG